MTNKFKYWFIAFFLWSIYDAIMRIFLFSETSATVQFFKFFWVAWLSYWMYWFLIWMYIVSIYSFFYPTKRNYKIIITCLFSEIVISLIVSAFLFPNFEIYANLYEQSRIDRWLSVHEISSTMYLMTLITSIAFYSFLILQMKKYRNYFLH